mgnify:CR=1 FL=1
MVRFGDPIGQLMMRGSQNPARLCQRVAFSIFLCFFLRIRLRRFLIREPMARETLAEPRSAPTTSR